MLSRPEPPPSEVSLPEMHRSILVPNAGSWLRRLLAFVGPGYLIAVGYMDPGNWATALAGGSAFGYTLLSVALISSLMAMLQQAQGAKRVKSAVTASSCLRQGTKSPSRVRGMAAAAAAAAAARHGEAAQGGAAGALPGAATRG
jgi:Mn2+/Fe2+ NRAMP family transporter